MEDLLKKQLLFQKIIVGLLSVMIVLMLAAGTMFVKQMSRMTTAVTEAAEKVQEIDMEGINDAIAGTQDMLESVDEFSSAVDEVTERVRDFDTWMSGIFGN